MCQTQHMQLIKSPRGGYSEFCPLLDILAFLCLVTLFRKLASCTKKSLFISMRFTQSHCFSFSGLDCCSRSLHRGRVLKVLSDTRSFELELTQSADAKLKLGSTHIFRVGSGDLMIGYQGRKIKANAAYYGKQWHLEQIFPIDGLGAKARAMLIISSIRLPLQ